LTAYTFSKALDNVSAFLGSKGNDNTPQNSYNVAAERGLSDFDLRQRFSLSFTYDLPFGTERRWKVEGSKFVGALLNNWQVSSIVTLETGRPFTPRLGTDNSNTGNVGGFFAHDRPNVVGDPNLETTTPDRFFNTAAFAIPPLYTFGYARRNVLIGPGLCNLGVALLKDIRLSTCRSLQFRTELFKFLKHPNLNLLEFCIDIPSSFRRILSARRSRQIQFGLKYLF